MMFKVPSCNEVCDELKAILDILIKIPINSPLAKEINKH
jgi:hypothetical protein